MSAAALPSDDLQEREGKNYVRLLNLLAAGQIALYLTTALWVPPYVYPQVPLLSFCRGWPVWVDVIVFVGSLAGTFFAKTPTDKRSRRIRHGVCAGSLLVLFVLNQHRFQPWAYQFFILHAWQALAGHRWKLTGWRWLTISIYAYSALSKFDYAFCVKNGPSLLDGFLLACRFADGTAHWPENLRFAAAAAMPVAELFVASCFCFQRTQRIGLWFSILMHLFLLVALGPLGLNHSAGVLIWNAFFIVQNWLLFSGLRSRHSPSAEVPHSESAGYEYRAFAGWGFLAFVLLTPLGEPFGVWDHWPSWAVYSARPERVLVLIHEDDVGRLPAELQPYLQPPAPLDVWRPLKIDRWSLDATRTPIYPQARFQIGVALALAEEHQLTKMKILVESSPNRWTGQRRRQEYEGLAAIQELANTFSLNALPR